MTIQEAQNKILEELLMFDDWVDRYTYIIACGASLPVFEDNYRTDDYLIKGCASKVWLKLGYENGCIMIKCDSDSLIVKGLLSLYYSLLNGRRAEEIAEAEIELFKQAGIEENIPISRNDGMKEFFEVIKAFASQKLP